MLGFSPVDGFMDVKEGVDEMIKYLANEPTVGLFFVQQHAQASMPYLLNVRDKVVEKVHEVTLHTEDFEDSIAVVQSMTDYGLPIADEMIKDINKSLYILSSLHPRKGLIHNSSWGFKAGRNNMISPRAGYNIRDDQQDRRNSQGYLSSVFSSAKQKATGFNWRQPYTPTESQKGSSSTPSAISSPLESPHGTQTRPEYETDKLSLSSHLDDTQEMPAITAANLDASDFPTLTESYDKFKSEREAKLEEWLRESEDESRLIKANDERQI